MKKLLMIFLILFASIVYADVDEFEGQSGTDTFEGATGCDTMEGQTIASGGVCTKAVDNSTYADGGDDDGWSITGTDTDYQEVKMTGENSICKIVVYKLYNSGSDELAVKVTDSDGNNDSSADATCTVDTGSPGETCTFEWATPATITGDIRIYLEEQSDGVAVRVDNSGVYETGYQLYIATAFRDWNMAFEVWTIQ